MKNREVHVRLMGVWFTGSPRRSHPAGMTLIEAILVLLIIGILIAAAVPKIDLATLFRPAVEGAAHMIASDIRYAQEFAMANRVSKSVRFVSGSSAYSFSPTHGLDPSGQLPSGLVIDNALTVTFNSLGEPIAGGGGSVSISGGGGTKTISINVYTGKVSIL